jgi:hypothetical protein
MLQDPGIRRALADGARRSREASVRVAGDSTLDLPAKREALTPEVLWRRYKWPLVGLGLFLLVELLSLSKLISTMGTHF